MKKNNIEKVELEIGKNLLKAIKMVLDKDKDNNWRASYLVRDAFGINFSESFISKLLKLKEEK